MDYQLKEDKSYVVMVAHKFEGKFKEFVWENGRSYAIFETGGENRFGPNVRKVAVINLISAELTKVPECNCEKERPLITEWTCSIHGHIQRRP